MSGFVDRQTEVPNSNVNVNAIETETERHGGALGPNVSVSVALGPVHCAVAFGPDVHVANVVTGSAIVHVANVADAED